MRRRSFLKRALGFSAAAAVAGAGGFRLLRPARERGYPGEILGASASVGHLLRDGRLPAPSAEEQIETVIVGGGVSGLSAAWWLRRSGYKSFTLLELEPEVGGNSRSGRNAVSAYPWGAHYVPLPGPEARYVRELFEEVGVIQGYDPKGLPIYNEFHLCADPHERLKIHGRWQDGIVPKLGLQPEDLRQYDEFFGLMRELEEAKGTDGRPAFAIPVDESSRDPRFTRLDGVSMAEFMRSRGWSSSYLHWYVSYCCRDDYGASHEQVSAWAGIHYFASRTGAASNAGDDAVLTWPEGNGWLVSRLREKVSSGIRTGALAYSVSNSEGGATVDYLDVVSRETRRIRARQVVFAAPRFVASRVLPELRAASRGGHDALRYSPWMVANVTLRALPEGNGAPLSWDNVSYTSESLGYIVATHQSLASRPRETVITYYLPLDRSEPAEARRSAAARTHSEWATLVANDLERMHPGIRSEITRVDVWLWGHGMISPGVGFIWGDARRKMLDPVGRIHFAHSDMSGISIFEEAQYRGVKAAQAVLRALGRPAGEVS